MFSANDRFRKSHDALFAEGNEGDFERSAISCVENYLENRRIWDELNYYKMNAKILGKHPVFTVRNEMTELRKLNSSDLASKRTNLYINILKTKKLLQSGKQPELKAKRQDSLFIKERLMHEIDTILKSR